MNQRRIVTLWLAAVLCSLGQIPVSAGEDVKAVVLEPGQGELVTLLQRELAKAAELDRVPFVQLTAEWCAPCKALRASFGAPLMQDALAGTYLIQVDVDAWRDEIKQAGFDHPAIPVFFAVDANARPTGAKIDGGAWGADIPRNMAPPLKRFFVAELEKATRN